MRQRSQKLVEEAKLYGEWSSFCVYSQDPRNAEPGKLRTLACRLDSPDPDCWIKKCIWDRELWTVPHFASALLSFCQTNVLSACFGLGFTYIWVTVLLKAMPSKQNTFRCWSGFFPVAGIYSHWLQGVLETHLSSTFWQWARNCIQILQQKRAVSQCLPATLAWKISRPILPRTIHICTV